MYLYGASGHAKVIIDSILSSTSHTIEAVYDDYSEEESLFTIPIRKNITEIPLEGTFVISIGDNQIRKKISQKLQTQYETIIHGSATISKLATKIGEGTVVMANVTVNAATTIGKHCIVNTAAVVEHDCNIGDFVHISPNATLAGNVTIGEGTHIGSGAVVIPGVTIGKWCVIGAGSTVIEDIPDYTVAVGCPAVAIKKHKLYS
ncbi:Putative acetyltransferase EpsM [Kordia antarctica]|uniref:Acetyltransferase EpsM n=1 Tax=Kordia antarctica TaxID=1218801 RepID=A0A7L4ZLP6_9FLAO|nr:acetyltransferase [Kordia antarctica]QHI37450.1 Putative acetyltransferase EpsM [Kordia antarctica]